MKKTFFKISILIIVLLVVLLIVQGIVNRYPYLFVKADSTEPDTTGFVLIPQNFNKMIEQYSGSVEVKTIGQDIYRFINDAIPEIYNNTKGMTETSLGRYYTDNIVKLNKYNIYSEQDFIKIAKKINRINPNENKVLITEIDLSTCENNDDYFQFVLRCYFQNIKCEFIVNLYNKEDKIEFKEYTPLDTFYDNYNGSIRKEEIMYMLDDLRDFNIYNIHTYTLNTLSDNAILQYYDLHTSEMNKIGIMRKEDYLEIAVYFIQLIWRDFTGIYYYDIDNSSIKEEEGYLTATVVFHPNTERDIKLKICVPREETETNKIKIKKANSDE